MIAVIALLAPEAQAAPDLALGPLYECSTTDEVWVEVQNAGTTATSGAWIDVFIGRPTPPPMGEIGDFYAHTGPLGAGQSQWYPIPIVPPSSGTYIDVLLDTDQLVAESNETNNAGWIWSDFASCALVDLEVQTLVTPASACRGEDIGSEVALTLHNPGPDDVSTLFNVAWYLSSNATLGSGDRLLLGGRDQVSALPSGSAVPVGIYANQIPNDAPLGAQYLLAVIDEFDSVEESKEYDNVISRPILIEDCAPEVVALTAGLRQTCALLDDGAVRCWGNGAYGVLGYGNTNSIGDNEAPSTAGDIPLGGDAVQVEAGYYHTCALLDTGAVRCWGRGSDGQLGYGNTSNIGDNEPPSAAGDINLGGSAVEIAAGAYHTCALLDTGAVRCWGRGSEGQLGYGHTQTIGDNEPPSAAGNVPLGGTAIALRAGEFHTCAILSGGALRCWGMGYAGQLGYGHTQTIGDNEAPSTAGNVNVGGTVVDVQLGSAHTCALLSSGAIRCWGQGGSRLGYGTTANIGDNEAPSTAGNVPTGFSFASGLAVGGEHSCALSSAGAVRCWGYIVSGGLGYGSPLPVDRADLAGDIAVGGPVQQLVAGYGRVCALLDDGAVRCWGDGAGGGLGYGNTLDIGDDETPASVGAVEVR